MATSSGSSSGEERRAPRPTVPPDDTSTSDATDRTGQHERTTSARSGLDALAARRVPRNIPPAPGGLLPTTRRGMFRYRVLPRSVIGISVMLIAFAVGAGFSGVVLFSYYQFRQNQADDKV